MKPLRRWLALTWLVLIASLARAQYPPDEATQKRTLRSIADFARQYIEHLPDFICVRTTEHWVSGDAGATWKLEVKVAQELSFNGHREHYQIVAVNDRPARNVPAKAKALGGYVDSGGNFGVIMGFVFDPALHADLKWQSWDYLHGKRVYAFGYRVARADSDAVSSKCSSWFAFTTCKNLKYSYHGVVYVDPESLDILRITHVPQDVPKSYIDFTMSVDYGRVTVAGNEYLLPVGDRLETAGQMQFRNESTYGSYRKFVAESGLKIAEAAPANANAPVKDRPPEPLPREASDCFELRDEVGRTKAPASARAMVDALFNHSAEAEKELLAILRSHPDPDEAMLVHAGLVNLYERSGHARQALEHSAPTALDDPHLKSTREMLEARVKYPEQTVAARGFSSLPFAETDDGVIIPVSVNGAAARFIVDTGAAISALSESQARALRVTVHEDHFPVQDFTGKDVGCRLGIADELAAGNFRLRNVPFCVMADTKQGPAGQSGAWQGILGLPVLLAFETVRWTYQDGTAQGKNRGGSFEIGLPSTRRDLARSNLCFAGVGLAVRAELNAKHLALDFDTGNDQTMLYPAFAGDFADVMKTAGPHKPHAFEGLGESIEIDSAELPELKLSFAGINTVLRDVPVFLAPPPSPSPCEGCSGILGLDIFKEARAVTLDFKAMKLSIGR